VTVQLADAALVDHIAATLQTRVLRGEIPSGTKLRQESLASEFGVSRTPVREALRKLQATGLVEVAPRRGAVVRAPSAREIREAYVVRAELEGLAAELAVSRIDERQLDGLRASVQLFRESIDELLDRRRRGGDRRTHADIERWTRANDSFHQEIQAAAGNARLRAMLFDLHRSFPRDLTGLVLSESSRLLQENVGQHAAILDAIERHDAAAARRRMVEHIHRAGELVVLRFEQRLGEG
jgi:DNA-binding GntR family transcriptional regulator